ncbi:MAG: filamentous hemagglutinin N-terminal domain-containing protein [Nitrospirota bacterium]|nr:filamentous hemagglutinin N-terminal domain-containing protein [Nitrospirota bacterium]MDP2382819.1 filamentous hemagglutinin N-terminal domain-containing protein [Nitrospirota bacterium]MDP3595462.1 filamentous hemagglutinin N-terminal domain-containing protein [Nitrospirota bacterium]
MAQQWLTFPGAIASRLAAITIGVLLSVTEILTPVTSQAQMRSAIVSDGTLPTPTAVTQVGNVYNINGGTIRGGNQFQSFDVFSVGTGDIASFNGPSGITNILSRVTGLQSGLQQSLIDGTLQTSIPGANLFLMNPAGVVFGPNATLNVSGSVTITSADYLRLGETGRFNATPGVADALLSAAPVAAFGFINPTPAPITVQGSFLNIPITTDPETSQPVGHALSLVGGDITVAADPLTGTPSYLSVPSGQIALVSVASPGEVLSPSLQSGANVTMGTIRLQEFSILDVSGSTLEGDGHAGTIRIRSGQLVMDSAIILADTVSGISGNNLGVSIVTQGDVFLANTSLILTESFGAGRSGDIEISARNVTIADGSLVQTITTDVGQGGNITVNASNSVAVTGTDSSGNPSNIQTLTFGTENGGSVSIVASSLNVSDNGFLQTASFGSGNPGYVSILLGNDLNVTSGGRISSDGGGVTSGNITITADQAFISGQSDQGRSRIENKNGTERTGNIEFNVRDLIVTDGARINNEGPGQSGNITIVATESVSVSDQAKIRMVTDSGPGGVLDISAPTFTMDQGILQTLAVRSGDAGAITLNADNVTLRGSQINSQTVQGLGRGGDVTINSTNMVKLFGQFTGSETDIAGPAGIFTTTAGLGAEAGSVLVKATAVELSEGARINSSTFGAGNAGTITVQGLASPADSITINGSGSGLFTDTQGSGAGGNITAWANQVQLSNGATISSKTSGSGNAGNILVKANDVAMSGGATITAASTGAGNAGTVTIQGTNSPANSIVIAGVGTGLFTDTQATGAGGNIDLNARTITLQNGGTVSANSSGTNTNATGGSITMNATDQVTMTGGSAITATSTGPGNAGNISINAGQQFDMRDSSINTESSQASGGNIDVQAIAQVRLVNSTISTSVLGGSGSGGNITIDPNVVVLQNSQIIAQAIQGAGGNITIFTPLFLADSTSLVSASSQFGLNGTVTIQSPTSNLSGSLGVLSSKTGQAQGLVTQRCAALANGQASSFVVAGREQLPADPGGWLTSPLAFAGLEPDRFYNDAVASAPMALTIQDTEMVSLRRITPPGFLLAHFAESEATGCRS